MTTPEGSVSSKFSSFPKIHAIGKPTISSIFEDEVEVTEKVDGSQMVFMVDHNGELHMRSKGAMLYNDAPQRMFLEGMEYIQSISEILLPGYIYYCEYLQKPKHNTLAYTNIPSNHLVLFGLYDIEGDTYQTYNGLIEEAYNLCIDVIPLLHEGKVSNVEQVHELLDTESYLGGCKVEGVVVKNYHKNILLGGNVYNIMAGKYVSEAFKEVHNSKGKKENASKGKWDVYKELFKTEARWEKAIQHVRDAGQLEQDPRDIGKLIKEVHKDITEECEEDIKAWLWKNFSGEILRVSTRGLPEWYKSRLLEEAFKDE